jgi:hypothetical protein
VPTLPEIIFILSIPGLTCPKQDETYVENVDPTGVRVIFLGRW